MLPLTTIAKRLLAATFFVAYLFLSTKHLQAQNLGTSATEWLSIQLPGDSALPKDLFEFIEQTKLRRPATLEQYIEMQRSLRTVAKRLVETIKTPTDPLYQKAESEFVNASVMLLGNEGADAQRKTFDRLKIYLKDRPKIEFMDVQMAILAGNNLEQLAADYSLAKEAYTSFAEVFRSKNDDSLADVIAILEANARRLDLPGKVLELAGSALSGDEFNVGSLRGKIVLVYFWASNARGCEQEVPQLLSIYKKYKDKGFEIVGVGLDEKKRSVETFVKRFEVPWINLWNDKDGGVSKEIEKFGVSAIPTSFLIDREGTVLTIDARTVQLDALLLNYFSPTDKPVKSPSEK
jgi:peroxiredoxin